MKLKQLQQTFQSSILRKDSHVEKNILPSSNLTPCQQIQIYQNAYNERIIAALKQDFPIMSAILGENGFASLVGDYIAHFPSQDFNLRYIGKNLSEFILSKDPLFIAYSELAKLEYVMCMQDEADAVNFESDFNVVDVYHHFHWYNQLVPLKNRFE